MKNLQSYNNFLNESMIGNSRYFSKLTSEEFSQIGNDYSSWCKSKELFPITMKDLNWLKERVDGLSQGISISLNSRYHRRGETHPPLAARLRFWGPVSFILLQIKDIFVEVVTLPEDYYLVMTRPINAHVIYDPFTFKPVYANTEAYKCDDLLGVFKLVQHLSLD